MKQEGLVSTYTNAQFKPQKNRYNEEKAENILNRKFKEQSYRNVVVSDLTYVRVGKQWNYVCVLIDLFNRQIIGYPYFSHRQWGMNMERNLPNIRRIKVKAMGLYILV